MQVAARAGSGWRQRELQPCTGEADRERGDVRKRGRSVWFFIFVYLDLIDRVSIDKVEGKK